MKKTIIAIILVLGTISAFAQDGRSIYNKYSDSKNVSAVYISPAMFRLIGKIPDMDAGNGDVNLTPIISSLSGLYIISSENKDVNAKMGKDVEKFLNSGTYELLMEAKDEGEKVTIFTKGSEKTVTGFVLFSDEGDEMTFICLDGNMDRESLENLIAGQSK